MGKNKLIIGAWLILVAVCFYSGFYASEALSINSDALVYPYLFDNFKLDTILVSEKHSNLLKMPLFALQSVAPYNHLTLTIFNVALFTATITLWCYLIIRILGKKYQISVLITAAIVTLFATTQNDNLIYNTVRNIEYPLSLWFLVETMRYVYKSGRPTWQFILSAILFSTMLAGDHFFRYTFALPIIITVIFLFILLRNKMRVRSAIAGSVAIGTVVLSAIIQTLFDIIGLYDIDRGYLQKSSPLPDISHVLTLVKITAKQILSLFNIHFPQPFIIKALIVLVIAALLSYIAYYLYKSLRKITTSWKAASVLSLALTGITVVGVYIAGGFAASLESGTPIPSDNQRYLTIFPLLLIPVLAHISFTSLQRFRLKKQAKIALVIIAVIVASIYFHPTATSLTSRQALIDQRQSDFYSLGKSLDDRDIDVMVSGYWSGAATRFWIGDKVLYAVAAECNKPSIENSRRDWYAKSPHVNKSALVIDMKGSDLPFLGYCPAEDLKKIYGDPIESYTIVNPRKHTNVWVYDYDIRSKLTPLPDNL